MIMVFLFLLGSSFFIFCIEHELVNLMQQLDALAIKVAAPVTEAEKAVALKRELYMLIEALKEIGNSCLTFIELCEEHLDLLNVPVENKEKLLELLKTSRDEIRGKNIKEAKQLLQEHRQALRIIKTRLTEKDAKNILVNNLEAARRLQIVRALTKKIKFMQQDPLADIITGDMSDFQDQIKKYLLGARARYVAELKGLENLQKYIGEMEFERLVTVATTYIDLEIKR